MGEKRDIKVGIKAIRDHPKFNSVMYEYDICIVTLDRDVFADKNINDELEVALLPNGEDCDNISNKKPMEMNATGWGYFHGCKYLDHLILR